MPDTTGYYFPRMRLTAPGAPEQLVSDTILRAMAQVARETKAFRKDLNAVAFVDGTPSYDFNADGFKTNDFSEVWFIEDSTNTSKSDADKMPLQRATWNELHTQLLSDETGQRPEFWAPTLGSPGEISVYPFNITPTLANAQIHVTAEVVPIRLAAQTYNIDPDTAHWGTSSFFDIAEEAIFNMAASYLLDYPGKPWTNRTQAKEFMFKALIAIGELKTLADDDMRSGVPRAVKYGGY